ncbi:hypothetical protein BC831DRAFT_416276 [Entophlyctis helioformis]|nr:hypothetical protein BC831DRAFT_416276 [Entophlyctis helioformis]
MPAAQAPAVPPPNPKGFFANERTFLSWLQLCLTLGAVAVGLLNFGDMLAQISGVVFAIVAVAFMLYSLIQFHIRADRLAKKEKSLDYEDMIGALVLITFVLLSVAINFALQFVYRNQ